MNSIKIILKRPADLPPRLCEPPMNESVKSKNIAFRHLKPIGIEILRLEYFNDLGILRSIS